MSMCLKHLAVWTVLSSLLLMGVTSVVEAGEPLEKVRQTINSVLVLSNQDLLEQARKAKIREVIL